MSLPHKNITSYLTYHYGRDVLKIHDHTKKAHEHHQSLLLDLQFLKNCRWSDVIPKFLWFKTANVELLSSPTYKDCQRRLFNVEIKSKYRDISSLKKDYLFYLKQLVEMIPENLLERVLEYITNRSIAVLCVKESNLKRKLDELGTRPTYVPFVDRNVVKNLSSRTLSDEEIDCLALGLDYGLIPKKY